MRQETERPGPGLRTRGAKDDPAGGLITSYNTQPTEKTQGSDSFIVSYRVFPNLIVEVISW